MSAANDVDEMRRRSNEENRSLNLARSIVLWGRRAAVQD
jgi:hypothetical protein